MTSKKNQLPFWGNDYKSMNLPRNVVSVIYHSEFFHNDLYKLKSFNEVIREVEKVVDVIHSRTPLSPSKCLMFVYKLHIMKMTKKQLASMISNSNPYIKVMAMIYTRFAIPPETQRQYYEKLMNDTSVVNFKRDRKMTISEVIKLLVMQKKFTGILAPRIPRKNSDALEDYVKRNVVRKRGRDNYNERNEFEKKYDKRRKIDHHKFDRNQRKKDENVDERKRRDLSPVQSRFSRPPQMPSNVVLSNTLYGEDSYENTSSTGANRLGVSNRLLSLLKKK